MSIIVIMLACLLTIFIYQYIKQRIVDRKNEELNQKANDAHIVKRRKFVFSNDLPSSQEETFVLRYIGNIEKYQDTPQGGDVGIYEDHFYVFTECDGVWHLLPEFTYS